MLQNFSERQARGMARARAR